MSRVVGDGEIARSAKFYDRFEWTTQGFFERGVGTYVESPAFCFEGATWHISLRTKEKAPSPNVFLNLWRTPSSGSRFEVRVGLKNKNGRDCMIVSYETDTDGFLEVRKFMPWLDSMPGNGDKLFPGGRLTVFCEICPSKKGEETSKLTGSSTDRLLQNLKDLYVSGQNSDVEVKVEDKIFKVHKGLLGARCPVFASMFLHDMQENSSGVVDIPDCSADAFEVFLLYLYTGQSNQCTSDTVCNLYYVADKYDAQELKQRCINFMKVNLSVDNFCDIVALSIRHNDSDLLEVATSFFSQNVKLIIKTSRWQEYLKENPIHANELYIKAIDA